jgi:hypothetical protein
MKRLLAVGVFAVACGSSTSTNTGASATYNIGGYYLGGQPPAPTGFVIATPGEPDLTDPGQPWRFANPVPSGTAYHVTVLQQPGHGTTCRVLDGGVGTVGTSDVTTVELLCLTGIP